MIQYTFKDNVKRGTDGSTAKLVALKTSVSSNGHTQYTTSLWSDGQLTCDCPGWCIQKAGQERSCKHIKASKKLYPPNSDMTPLAEWNKPIVMPKSTASKPGERQHRAIVVD